MQFRVPQFIDIEDKVFGPFTLKQFAYMAGAGGFSFLIWTFIPIRPIAFILIVVVAGFFLSLAFVKFNNRPFIEFVESIVTYYTNARVYTWKQPVPVDTANPISTIVAETEKEIVISKTNQNKIHDISLGLDVFEHGVATFDDNPQEEAKQ